jgi:glycosyltransferase involved in cell wall biosynthesis
MTAVDVVVVATHNRIKEALSLVLIEAMACGTPVAAYATGGIPEVVGLSSEAGLLAKADDPNSLSACLVEVLSDQELAKQLSAGGLNRVKEHFDSDSLADRYETFFRRLTA